MKNYTSFYGGEKNSFYGSFIQNTSEERVLKRGPSQTVSFNAEKLVQLLSLTADFYPIQSGNGQPSPENIRTISGRTSADICISPTSNVGDGKIYHVVFPTSVGTAYGGTIDMINKTLTINYLYKTFTGQEDWEIYSPPKAIPYCRSILGPYRSVINDSGICSHFPNKIINSFSIEDGQRIVNSSAVPYAIICIRYAEKQKTVDEFKDWLREQYSAGTPVQVAYKISNPTVYNIDIDSVILYPNDNNIWIENGDITIQYKINKNVYYNTVNGNPCILDKSVNTLITNLLLNIQPMQDLHGYDAPWPSGSGKNKFDSSVYSDFLLENGKFRGIASQIMKVRYKIPHDMVGSPVTFSACLDVTDSGPLTYTRCEAYVSGEVIFGTRINNGSAGYSSVTFTPTSENDYVRLSYGSYGSESYTFYDIQLESGSDATAYSPYSNICPISGWTGANIRVSPTADPADGRTYSVEFPSAAGTVHGGTLDVTRGLLTVDRIALMKNTAEMDNSDDYPGWKKSGIRDIIGANVNASIKGAIGNIGNRVFANTNGTNDTMYFLVSTYGKTQSEWIALAMDVQFVIPLNNSVTYQLTPTQINALDKLTILTTDVDNIIATYKAKNK